MSSELSGDEQFKCEWIYLDGGVFVTLFGELDTASAPVLADCLAHLVNEGATHLEVDVSELEFIDSTGLTVVMEQWHRLQALGGSLYLLSPGTAIQKMLDITGLAPFLLNADPAGLFEGQGVTPHTRDELRFSDRDLRMSRFGHHT
jgi:anti-sigma B factor antagonist